MRVLRWQNLQSLLDAVGGPVLEGVYRLETALPKSCEVRLRWQVRIEFHFLDTAQPLLFQLTQGFKLFLVLYQVQKSTSRDCQLSLPGSLSEVKSVWGKGYPACFGELRSVSKCLVRFRAFSY